MIPALRRLGALFSCVLLVAGCNQRDSSEPSPIEIAGAGRAVIRCQPVEKQSTSSSSAIRCGTLIATADGNERELSDREWEKHFEISFGKPKEMSEQTNLASSVCERESISLQSCRFSLLDSSKPTPVRFPATIVRRRDGARFESSTNVTLQLTVTTLGSPVVNRTLQVADFDNSGERPAGHQLVPAPGRFLPFSAAIYSMCFRAATSNGTKKGKRAFFFAGVDRVFADVEGKIGLYAGSGNDDNKNLGTRFELGIGGLRPWAGPRHPTSLAIACTPDGVYIADSSRGRLYFASDEGSAKLITAQLETPSDLALASDGRLYLSETNSRRVVRLEADGKLTVVAGYGATNGCGTALGRPTGLAFGRDGRLLIADSESHVIWRRTESQGQCSLQIVAGILRTADTIVGAPSSCSAGATGCPLLTPASVVEVADGTFIVAEADGHRLRRVTAQGITPFAGRTFDDNVAFTQPPTEELLANRVHHCIYSWSGLNDASILHPSLTEAPTSLHVCYPTKLLLTPEGDSLLVQTRWPWLHRIPIAGGPARLELGGFRPAMQEGGPASRESFLVSTRFQILPGNELAMLENWQNRVRKVATDGTVSTLVGNGKTAMDLSQLGSVPASQMGISVADFALSPVDNLLSISDVSVGQIFKMQPDGSLRPFAGVVTAGCGGVGGPATAAPLPLALRIAHRTDGALAVIIGYANTCDQAGPRVRLIPADGRLYAFAGGGTITLGFNESRPGNTLALTYPLAIEGGPDNVLYVSDGRFDGPHLVDPRIIAFDRFGNGRIIAGLVPGKSHPEEALLGGRSVDALSLGFQTIDSIAAGSDGVLYVADSAAKRIYVLKPDGAGNYSASLLFGGPQNGDCVGSVSAKLDSPSASAVRTSASALCRGSIAAIAVKDSCREHPEGKVFLWASVASSTLASPVAFEFPCLTR